MSVVSSALSSLQGWRERQQDRQEREQLATTEEESVDVDVEQQNSSRTPQHPLQDLPAEATEARDEEERQEEFHPDNETAVLTSSTGTAVETIEAVPDDEEIGDVDGTSAGFRRASSRSDRPQISRRAFTLADLREEREVSRRRTSVCVLVAIFLLFRLWIAALQEGNFFLLMMCLMGSSWTARFIRHTREREEEIEHLISEYSADENGNNSNGEEGNRRASRELQRLSFQAQLAMAILNSQRDMMEGGFGHPEGGPNTPGVTEEVMEQWDHFQFKPGKDGYGSVLGIDDLEKATRHPHSKDEEGPQCSICLGEYEEGEDLVCLPCKHIYHADCIASWCSNHVRCPLCNLDLESVSGDTSSTVS